MTADWEGLKALQARVEVHVDGPNQFKRMLELQFPAILAEHERDQRVIEAAEKLKAIVAVIAYNLPISESVARIDLNRALAEYDKAKQ